MLTVSSVRKPPFTLAVRQALQGVNDSVMEADLLFLEAWEIQPSPHLGVTLRASQIRRANPDLAAAIDAELKAQSAMSMGRKKS
jgi:hypothetical protein